MALKIEGFIECEGKTYEAIDYRKADNDDHWLFGKAACKGKTTFEAIILREVKPPAPKYRPFANAEEFKPHRERWWCYKTSPNFVRPPQMYSDTHWNGCSWQDAFDERVFDDGTPCGVLVTE